MPPEQADVSSDAVKPAHELSMEELQALLDKKKAEQEAETTVETVEDTSYVEMATAEAPGLSAEEQEETAEQIETLEAELQTNVEELSVNVAEADAVLVKAEAALAADPDSVESKLVMERIQDAYDSAQKKLNNFSRMMAGYTAGGVITGALLSNMYMYSEGLSSQDVATVGVGMATLTLAIHGIGTVINKFRSKQAAIPYYA